MTEFEIATIAYQNSSLDLQSYAIWAQVGVGLLHAALIGVGLLMMHRASKERNKLMDEDRGRADKRHREAMDNIRTRHDEAKAWHEQVMNEGRTRHEEAMNESRVRHEEAMTALKELIARTAPPSPPSASPAG